MPLPAALLAVVPAVTGALGAGGAAAGAGGAAAGASGAAGAAAGGAGASGMLGNLAKQFGPQIVGGLMGGGGGGGDQQGGGGGMPNPMDMATDVAGGVMDTVGNIANQGFNAMLDRAV
jgi:hypothetical protein